MSIVFNFNEIFITYRHSRLLISYFIEENENNIKQKKFFKCFSVVKYYIENVQGIINKDSPLYLRNVMLIAGEERVYQKQFCSTCIE